MLSIAGSAMRPSVTVDAGVSQRRVQHSGKRHAARDPRGLRGLPGVKRASPAGAREETNRCTPEPASAACRLRQACAPAWLAISARRSRIDRRVGFARRHHRNTARRQQRAQPDAQRQRVSSSPARLPSRAPASSPPCAASSTTTKRGCAGGILCDKFLRCDCENQTDDSDESPKKTRHFRMLEHRPFRKHCEDEGRRFLWLADH